MVQRLKEEYSKTAEGKKKDKPGFDIDAQGLGRRSGGDLLRGG